jgi:GT2 family glycosyltransferase
MRKAMAAAMSANPDYYFWLNDDVCLFPEAIGKMIETAHSLRSGKIGEPIVVGSTVDPGTGRVSYGGRVRPYRLRPLYFSLVEPGETALPCETMNANCVLLPGPVVALLGNLDPAFVHSMGDWDYGLRAVRAGCRLFVCPGYVGQCSEGVNRRNLPVSGDSPLEYRSMRIAWRGISGPKAFPVKAWRTFTWRHGGPFWIAHWLKPYANALWWGLFRGGI